MLTIILFSIILLSVVLIWFVFFILSLKGKINPHRFFNSSLYTDFNFNTVPDREMNKVFEGFKIASNSRIIITGLTRDNESKIVKNITNLALIGNFFKDYRIVIFENDSKDDTRNLIKKEAEKNSHIELLGCEEEPNCILGSLPAYDGGLFKSSRIEKMSRYRNRYLEHIYQNYHDWDYVFVCDMDMEGIFFKNGFFHAISLTTSYNAVFANGMMNVPGLMILSPYDGMAYSTNELNHKKSNFRKFFHQLRTCRNSSNPVEVKSAFNGGAIYNMKAIKGYFYNSIYSCEHNALNYSINGKLCIDPSFMIYAGMQGHF